MSDEPRQHNAGTNSEIGPAGGEAGRREQLLRQDTPLALFLVFTLIFAIAASLLGVAFKIEGFPYRELMGISALLVLVVWAGQRSLAAIAILVLAATIMPENLFRSTQGVFFGILGQAAQSDAPEQVDARILEAQYKPGESRLDEIDRARFLETARLLHAVALSTSDDTWFEAELSPPRSSGESSGDIELENLAGLALRGLAQAEVLRLSAWYLTEANLIDCATASGFEVTANTEIRRLRLSSELESCTATRAGLQYIAPSLLEASGAFIDPYMMPAAPAAAYVSAPQLRQFDMMVVQPSGPSTLSDSLDPGIEGELPFQVLSAGRYVIAVDGQSNELGAQDPRIALFRDGPSGPLVGEDDDSGTGVNARLAAPLCPGLYSLVIDEYFDRPLDFTLRISRDLDAAAPQC